MQLNPVDYPANMLEDAQVGVGRQDLIINLLSFSRENPIKRELWTSSFIFQGKIVFICLIFLLNFFCSQGEKSEVPQKNKDYSGWSHYFFTDVSSC